ncbi:MAG: prolyl oligopeptidase family serine peptidase [Verrucomicrobiota bacterium]|jgi:predicted peptidase|nr:prolyl oligopeptidase family serine peptidase [Verrucomicrobiota bacterium]MDP7048891.1 prolyl oligopeptidase family serine peptidase [Verrucomicrobiota bacterium]
MNNLILLQTGLKQAATIAACFLFLKTTTAADLNQTKETFSSKATKTYSYNYLKYLPDGYDGKKKFPLMLFLHGAGERGDNLELVTKHGPPKLIKNGKKFPFIVISPQCPKGNWWKADGLDALLDDLISKHAVDESRIYCTGLSMGGFGTWAIGGLNPKRFAALAPICGGGSRIDARQIGKKPVWVFHGAKDKVVPLTESERMVDALKQRGGKPRFTIYPEAGHDSWTEAYNNPKLYEWFLSHKTE